MKPPIHLEERETDGARIISPTAARNAGPIAKTIGPFLPGGSRVLGIADGTGQQAAAILAHCADVTWQPSDPDRDSRGSLATYHNEMPDRIAAPLHLDVSADSWWDALPGEYTHMFCANMIHIAPPEALMGLAAGATAILPKDGRLFLYGPFLFGEDSAQSNLEFSERLKLRNPQWGVRELHFVKHIFAKSGLTVAEQIEMPANNHLLVVSKI